MKRWESVARRYADLNPEPTRSLSAPVLSRLQTWLEDDVVSLLGELTRLPRFRELATFSLRTLTHGTNSDQRRAVERVDCGLTEAARAILAVVERPSVRARLESLQLIQRPASGGVIEIGAEFDRATPVMSSSVSTAANSDQLDFEIAAVRSVALRDWDDLVCPDDFFTTRQEFVQADDGSRLQRGEMINSVNPRLLPIGDLVARSLRRRIEVRSDQIQILRMQIRQVLTSPRLLSLAKVKRWGQAEDELTEAIRRLEAMVFDDSEAVLRDSCVSLTQVYTAMHPDVELEWLGLNDELILQARRRFPSLLRGHQGNAVFDRIARAVQDMAQLYRGLNPNTSQLEMAITSGGLVIHQPSQSAWWERTQICLRNGAKQFEFLAALARKAYRRQAVTEDDLYPDGIPSKSTMANRWNRLGVQLPSSLAQRIQPGVEPRTYRLDLERHQIFLIR